MQLPVQHDATPQNISSEPFTNFLCLRMERAKEGSGGAYVQKANAEQEKNVTPDQTQKPDAQKIEEAPRKRSNRGFAGMDARRQREIASEGGRAAHAQGKAHEFTPEEAREAGRKGGQASGYARSRVRRQAQQEETIAGEPHSPGVREGPPADERGPDAEEKMSI